MNKMLLKQLAVLAAGITLTHASVRAETLAAKADIKFKGSSTLHDFEGTVTTQPFAAEFKPGSGEGQWMVKARTALEVRNMTTHNKKRDKNMFKMFDLQHFAQIEGELPETLISEAGRTDAKLHLKIRDVEGDVTATISDVQRTEKQISCTMAFPVSLKAFNLKGPSVMGLIRVDEMVYVECTVKGEIGESVEGN